MSSAFAVAHRVAGLLLAAMATLATPARAADGDAAERARLAEERSSTEARFVARDAECRQRFVVSECVADARQERRIALDALRVRQQELDDGRRQQRAAERRAALAAKAAEDSQRERERPARAASSPAAGAAGATGMAASSASPPRAGKPFEARREPRNASPAKTPSASHDRQAASNVQAKGSTAKTSPATRQQLEEQHRAAFAARQREAARHRDEAVGATILRMEKHAPASSLPLPSAPPARPASAP